ncbi:unnamed protein product, partial [Ixodes hexagonus]
VAEEEAPVEEEEGQVIGYFQLDHNRLQLLVEGENTFYLPPEALGEHVLMTEDGKEGQQIIVVVEEGSGDAVVQAFDARALLGDEATFTVDQLQGALAGSVSLSDHFAGMTAITTGDQQQLLILSEDPGDKESCGLEDMAVVPGASPGGENADTENTLLYQESSGEVPPEQCGTASDAVHGELQPGLEELPEGTGDLDKTLEALGSGSDILGSSTGLEACPGALSLSGNLEFVAENEQASQEELGKCAEADFGMQSPVVEDNSERSKGQIELGFGSSQAGSEMNNSVDPGNNGLLQGQSSPAALVRQEEPDISQEGNQEQPLVTGHDENEALTMTTERFGEELLEQASLAGAQQGKVSGVVVAYPTQASLPAASEYYDQPSSVKSIAGGDGSFHETITQLDKLLDVQGAKNSEDKLEDNTGNILHAQLDCNTQSRSICEEIEVKLDQHKCSNMNEHFNKEKKENREESDVDVNELLDKQPDENRSILSQSSKEGFSCSAFPRNSELDIDEDSQNITCHEISAAKCHGESEGSRISEAVEAAQAVSSETPAEFGQSTPNQMTSSSDLIKDKELIRVTSASDSYASTPEKSPVNGGKEDGSLKEAAFEEAGGHLMLPDVEPEKEGDAQVKERNVTDMKDKFTPNEVNCLVKETIADATEQEALQPRLGTDAGSTSYENVDGQSQGEWQKSPDSTGGQSHCEDGEAYSADHDRSLEETAHESTKEAEFSDDELQKQGKDKAKGNALSTDSSILLESGTSGSKDHDSSRELSDLDQSGEKLLAALDLMPCPEASNLPTNGTAKPPQASKPREIFPELKLKRKRARVSQDEASSPGKKRWSLRTPTKPRKRVIIPDSDDDDFDVYESYGAPDDTQKNKSEEAFDALLSFFKIEKAQQEAAEAAGTKKRNAKKSPKVAAPSRKTHRKSLKTASSTPKEIRSPKEMPTAKVTPSLKQQRVKSLENVARKNSSLKRQENACMAPSPSPAKQQASAPTKQAPLPAKQARKRRSELTESVFPKEDVLAESCKRIPSLSDTFAGDIHIRCQKPSCSSDKGVPRYHCSKCGFRSARVENIIWHHKQDCPYTRNLHRWDPEPWNQAGVSDKSLQQPA